MISKFPIRLARYSIMEEKDERRMVPLACITGGSILLSVFISAKNVINGCNY